jgi:hypothetical protein
MRSFWVVAVLEIPGTSSFCLFSFEVDLMIFLLRPVPCIDCFNLNTMAVDEFDNRAPKELGPSKIVSVAEVIDPFQQVVRQTKSRQAIIH